MFLNDLVVTKLLSKFCYAANNQTKDNDAADSIGEDKPTTKVIRSVKVPKPNSQYCYITKVQS